MEKFIRIDMKGHWRGTEHRSSVNGFADEFDNDNFEEGVSCYSLKNVAEGIEELRKYWVGNNGFNKAREYEGLQVTIFEGEKLEKSGADFEDLAECTATIAELDAVEFMGKVFAAYEQLDGEEITEEEYNAILEKLI